MNPLTPQQRSDFTSHDFFIITYRVMGILMMFSGLFVMGGVIRPDFTLNEKEIWMQLFMLWGMMATLHASVLQQYQSHLEKHHNQDKL